ncbi:putative calcium-binding protein CML20 [Zea mays]|jgi:calcium-binding protein CML|uniref:Polcalcin Jun o 2 n=2 Tax=Zea mays TaxID=4577 RepID=B6U492_MAIZE|nr:polcalcin Jun o 2 [Zea mays]ACG44175.1 polcalcin Jun o 2 [Zea mays]AQK55133.1 Polcalcin Jun o 2 [Zea mays]PWZ27704.1 putative calcium-binding protein CML20 [Zea mays]|eukprot:NP_001151735.1 polcalcin Jun o 2 [Zea mays]
MGLVVSATASCSDIFFSRRRSSSPPPPAAASTPPPTYTIPEPALVRVFRHFDADGDGRISADEMRELCGCTAVEADEMVAVADRDGDGFISLEELEALFEDGDRSDTLRAAFAEYDENGDGVITAEELRRALWRLGIVGEEMTAERCAEMIAVVDIDGDGVVCFDEFKAMMDTAAAS